MNPSAYPDKIWKLFREPRRHGCFEAEQKPSRGRAATPASHAVLQLELLVAPDGRIDDALFQALGCPYLIATGAWLCAHVTGRRRDAMATLEPRLIAEQLDLPAVKRYCAVMAVEALNQALDDAPTVEAVSAPTAE